jgi:hypothetical protein
MRGFLKICLKPLLCANALFFKAAPGRARAIEKFFLPVSHFLHQNETTAG